MNFKTPEQVGISSAHIKEYVNILENNGLSTHSVIIARGDDIVFEKYWAPFDANFTHRLYSVTKSFVSIAVGFAIQDGYFGLDDKISIHFPEEIKLQKNETVKNQTVRHMLMMSTGFSNLGNWFTSGTKDRVKHYFAQEYPPRPSGTQFMYDSEGSFVLGVLIERKTGMTLLEYLRIKLFDKIGVSSSIRCLKCPGGHSWGDSAILATSRDLLLVARFVLNGGSWNGEQLLDAQYVKEATSDLIDTNPMTPNGANKCGYGYLIWRTYDNSFYFNGMGCQYAVCVPDKDIILIHTADNQGDEGSAELVIRSFFDKVVRRAVDSELPENKEAYEGLGTEMKLMTARGNAESSFVEKTNDVIYKLEPNPMGISKLSLHFDCNRGEMRYTNAQGDKVIHFGMLENEFDYFPQEGYSKEIGAYRTTGHFYRYAASGAWTRENELHIKVQIIDDYFGRLDIRILFYEDNKICVRMQKAAEDFLGEYQGLAYGTSE